MADHIRERITRKLDTLTDERLYQVLDYVEFLESKYAARQNPATNPIQKFTESIEDRLRAGRVSASTISQTMGFLNKAVGVLDGAVAAGKSVAADLASAAQRVGSAVTDVASQATGSAGDSSTPGGTTPPAPPGSTPPGPTGPATGERPT